MSEKRPGIVILPAPPLSSSPKLGNSMNTLSILNPNQQTMSTREIANILGKNHSDIKRSAERRLGVNYCSSVSFVFKNEQNGQLYEEYTLDLDSAETLITQLSTKSRALNSLEETALSTIEQLLSVELVRQFGVGKYRIDGYDTQNKIAYEIDEQHHATRNDKDQKRQREIEDILGCTFVRIAV